MTTIVLDRLPPPSTEGASSRLNCIVEHLQRVDPGCRVLYAWSSERPRGRAWLLLASLPRIVTLVLRAVGSANSLILLSSPALPFFQTESRIDGTLAGLFLRLLRLGARLTGKTIVLNLHDLRSIQLPAFGLAPSDSIVRFYRRLERRTLATCDFVLAHTGDWPDYLMRQHKLPRDRIVEFPNGNARRDVPARAEIARRPGLKLVYAGTMGQPGRSLEAFLECFRAVERQDVALYLVGPGAPADAAADPRVHVLGPLPLSECIAVVRACDVAVYPYPDADYFNMMHTTNKMALYVTCERPILARASRHVRSFLEAHDIGVAVPIDEMTRTIAQLPDDLPALGRQRRNLARIADDYFWDTIIDRAWATIARRAGLPGAVT